MKFSEKSILRHGRFEEKTAPNVLTFSVIIPSWKRPEYLRQCLLTLRDQNYQYEVEFLVVLRPEDTASIEVVEQMKVNFAEYLKSLRVVWVNESGFVKALHEGFVHSRNEIVAFCDDDAKYPENWLQYISEPFVSEYVGGVGGPIKENGIWQGQTKPKQVARVSILGQITYGVRSEPKFSSLIEVDSLPGANMSYRRNLLAKEIFDTKLDHQGSAPGNELLIGWSVRNQGYKLVYNPNCVVEHFSAPWIESSRADICGKSKAFGFNLHYVFARCAPKHKLFIFIFWSIVFGNKLSPGLILVLLEKLSRKSKSVSLKQSLNTKFEGTRCGFAARKLNR